MAKSKTREKARVTARVDLKVNECKQCGHIWVPRNDWVSRMCPNCKSVRWNDKVG